MPNTTCRCGWDGQGDHPCHANAYTCRKPAKARYYEPTRRYAIAGFQMKMSISETYACDECWEALKPRMEAFYKAEAEQAKAELTAANALKPSK